MERENNIEFQSFELALEGLKVLNGIKVCV